MTLPTPEVFEALAREYDGAPNQWQRDIATACRIAAKVVGENVRETAIHFARAIEAHQRVAKPHLAAQMAVFDDMPEKDREQVIELFSPGIAALRAYLTDQAKEGG